MRVPKYCKNGDGRAFVAHPSIPTKSHRKYLGTYGTRASREEYERWVTEFMVSQGEPPAVEKRPRTIAELVVEYLTFARGYYVENGVPTKEFTEQWTALQHILDLFPDLLGADLGPGHLQQLQKSLIGKKYRRGVINQRVRRVKRFVKWCCVSELIPGTVFHGLSVVDGLRKGRTTARESEKVKPAPREHVDALLPFMSPTIGAMVQLQLLCGMRPAEVCIMRPMDLDRSRSKLIWLYRPESHKTENSGRDLVKAVPPEAQKILEIFLAGLEPEQYVFSPASTKEWRYSNRGYSTDRKRTTPVYPSELKARERLKAERARKRRTRWGDCYTTDSYRRAIYYAHATALRNGVDVPRWHPHQLRHTIATEVSHTLGEQAASVWLGHASLDATAIYTERNISELITVAEQLEQLKKSAASQRRAQSSAASRRGSSSGVNRGKSSPRRDSK